MSETTTISQSGFIVGIGSNISPDKNLPLILHTLIDKFASLSIGRIIETPPIGMESSNSFLNTVVFVPTSLEKDDLKAYFNQVETVMGRDRSDPLCSKKDRPADLDILFEFPFKQPLELLVGGDEEYLLPSLCSLMQHLNVKTALPSCKDDYPAVQLTLNEQLGQQVVGEAATTIHRHR